MGSRHNGIRILVYVVWDQSGSAVHRSFCFSPFCGTILHSLYLAGSSRRTPPVGTLVVWAPRALRAPRASRLPRCQEAAKLKSKVSATLPPDPVTRDLGVRMPRQRRAVSVSGERHGRVEPAWTEAGGHGQLLYFDEWSLMIHNARPWGRVESAAPCCQMETQFGSHRRAVNARFGITQTDACFPASTSQRSCS